MSDNKSVSRFESSSDRSSDVFNLNELLRSEELRRKFNTCSVLDVKFIDDTGNLVEVDKDLIGYVIEIGLSPWELVRELYDEITLENQ